MSKLRYIPNNNFSPSSAFCRLDRITESYLFSGCRCTYYIAFRKLIHDIDVLMKQKKTLINSRRKRMRDIVTFSSESVCALIFLRHRRNIVSDWHQNAAAEAGSERTAVARYTECDRGAADGSWRPHEYCPRPYCDASLRLVTLAAWLCNLPLVVVSLSDFCGSSSRV